MISYFELGGEKRLNEIVMAGSHDAGITEGGSNVQTQDLDIGSQAYVGVRVFDLRVTGATVPGQHGEDKQVQLRAFHADPKLMKDETKSRYVPEVGRTQDVTRTKLKGGAFGQGLEKMLRQARAFVEEYSAEFLILKFDKCSNWELIAELCVKVLGNAIYTGAGNLNTKTLTDLMGKVICLFTQSGLAAIPQKYKNGGGILGVKNLYSGGAYDDQYDGMQYFGKGGTSLGKPFKKQSQTEKKQGKLMSKGVASDPNVMGMMYWTTTGVFESIRKRNDKMWEPKNVNTFKQLWKDGLSESIETRLSKTVDPTSFSSAPILKAFMPNIVMVDFSDEEKCKVIYGLNNVAAVEFTYAARFLELENQDEFEDAHE